MRPDRSSARVEMKLSRASGSASVYSVKHERAHLQDLLTAVTGETDSPSPSSPSSIHPKITCDLFRP